MIVNIIMEGYNCLSQGNMGYNEHCLNKFVNEFFQEACCLKTQFSIEVTLCIMLFIYNLYIIWKYLYNESYYSKDKLTIAICFLFLGSITCNTLKLT